MAAHLDPYSPERLADRARIHDLILRWSRAIDRLDLDAIRDVFHADAIDNHGAYNGGVEGLIDWIRNRHSRIPFSMHLVGNMLIEFADDDNAVVESYTMTMQRYPREGRASLTALVGDMPDTTAAATDLLICARYVDHVSRRDGVWRIATRHVIFDSSTVVDAASAEAFASPALERGRRSREDRIFAMRAELGVAGGGRAG
jgi:hypothetical protein